jgi:hypothetical protein
MNHIDAVDALIGAAFRIEKVDEIDGVEVGLVPFGLAFEILRRLGEGECLLLVDAALFRLLAFCP